MVGCEVSATYETDESGSVHNVASCYDEVVEVWTSQPNNPTSIYHSGIIQ